MTIWHTVLYSAAAVLALRSFVQLMTNYRVDYEQTAVASELTRMKEEAEARAALDQGDDEVASVGASRGAVRESVAA